MRTITTLASALGGLLVAILVTMTTVAVFMRYALGMPFQWTEEVSGILMIWIILLGGIACEWHRQHLSIDFVVEALPQKTRRTINIGIAIFSAAVLLVVAYLAWQLGEIATFKRTQILRISWFWLDLAVVVGSVLTAATIIYTAFRAPAPEQSAIDNTAHDEDIAAVLRNTPTDPRR